MDNETQSKETEVLERYISKLPAEDRDVVQSAREFSKRVRGIFADNPQILTFEETLSAVQILIELGMDNVSIAAGFLHDLYRFPDVMKKIKRKFSNEIHDLVKEYGNISLLAKQAKKGESEDNYIRMALAIAHDFRVILMMLVNRYLRILHHHKRQQEEMIKQAERVLAFYAPLAHRLGLSKYKTLMEDKAFEILHPDIYADISARVSDKRYEFDRYLNQVGLKLKYELKKRGISPGISGRTKHIVSIHRKMQRTGKPFDQIYDIMAVRAIVKTIPECYKILAIVQQLYKPILEEFDDYIQRPKINGYQSLHLLVEDKDNRKFELQIRTKEMHRTAEIGVAAHWNYKTGSRKSTTDAFFRWFREHATDDGRGFGHKAFEKFFHLSELKDDIFVLTPKGDLIRLARGSTPIDFAFAIHKEVGLCCSGAKINGKIVPFNRELRNGDRVEVMTSNQPTVNADWTKYARTTKALTEIRRWLRKKMRMQSIKLGEEILARAFRRHKISMTNEALNNACEELHYNTIEDLFAAVGSGRFSAQVVVQKLIDVESSKKKEKLDEEPQIHELHPERTPPASMKVGGMDDLMVNFGKCCLPVPGDPIVGYITRGKGVTVHRITCKSIRQLRLEPEREINVEWAQESNKLFTAGLKVVHTHSENFIKDITPIFGNRNIKLINYQTKQAGGHDFCILVIEIPNTEELRNITQKINSMKSVKSVSRLQYSEFKSLIRSSPVPLGGE